MHIYKKSTKNNKLFVFRTYEQPPINSLLPKTHHDHKNYDVSTNI